MSEYVYSAAPLLIVPAFVNNFFYRFVRSIRVLMLILFVLLTAACDRDNGGIAGASFDAKKYIAEIENYQAYASPQILERTIKNQCHGSSSETWAGIAQHFDDIFRSFAFHLEGLEGPPVPLPGMGLRHLS